jgi:hypothetical protein
MPTDDPSAITIRPTAAGVKRTAPLVVIFAEQLQHRRRVELALAGREATISTGCWQEFELALAAVGATIAVIVWPHADAALWRLRRLKDRCPTRSVILITGRDADNARALRGAPVNQLIWLSEIERALWPAVRAGALPTRSGESPRRWGTSSPPARSCAAP